MKVQINSLFRAMKRFHQVHVNDYHQAYRFQFHPTKWKNTPEYLPGMLTNPVHLCMLIPVNHKLQS